ncbi:MAG TPA: hypothetical protein VL137_00070 [Polyangiaceae bacterium]|nr:hypothetical protein [Polyangiaceae bacterium]
MRQLSAVEFVVAFSVAASVVAVAIPVFARNLRASRFAEPMEGLAQIAAQAAVLGVARAAEGAYPASVGLTPSEVPHGRPQIDPPGTWDQETWRQLGFEQLGPHYFSFAFESRIRGGGVQFTALAHGDLDGDGAQSTFSISGEAQSGAQSHLDPLYMNREVE